MAHEPRQPQMANKKVCSKLSDRGCTETSVSAKWKSILESANFIGEAAGSSFYRPFTFQPLRDFN